MEKKKFKLHKSFEDRTKENRNTVRKTGWGQGLVQEAKLDKSLFKLNFIKTWFGISILYIVVKILPYRILMLLGKSIGFLMSKLLKSRRYILKCNIDLAFPDLSITEKEKLMQDIFYNSGMAIFETGMAWFWSDKQILKYAYIDEDELKKAKEYANNNTRTIVLTAHFVTLELMARMYALLVKPGIGVYRKSDHPVIEYIQVKGRLRSNKALVDRRDPKTIVRSLMQGYPIWYAPDQDYGTTGAVFVPFFAVDKVATITATHELARIKDTIVQPSFTIREKNRYRLYVQDKLENFPSKDKVLDTKRCNEVIEDMIKIAPEQYLWLHRRFKSVPEGESSRYPNIEN